MVWLRETRPALSCLYREGAALKRWTAQVERCTGAREAGCLVHSIQYIQLRTVCSKLLHSAEEYRNNTIRKKRQPTMATTRNTFPAMTIVTSIHMLNLRDQGFKKSVPSGKVELRFVAPQTYSLFHSPQRRSAERSYAVIEVAQEPWHGNATQKTYPFFVFAVSHLLLHQ